MKTKTRKEIIESNALLTAIQFLREYDENGDCQLSHRQLVMTICGERIDIWGDNFGISIQGDKPYLYIDGKSYYDSDISEKLLALLNPTEKEARDNKVNILPLD